MTARKSVVKIMRLEPTAAAIIPMSVTPKGSRSQTRSPSALVLAAKSLHSLESSLLISNTSGCEDDRVECPTCQSQRYRIGLFRHDLRLSTPIDLMEVQSLMGRHCKVENSGCPASACLDGRHRFRGVREVWYRLQYRIIYFTF